MRPKRRYILLIAIPILWVGISSFFLPDDNKLRTVVIDAGHGGHDPGCLGSSAKEKDIALAVALKLGGYIEKHLPDVKVIYTRKTDVFIELRERAAIANRNNADLFISVHINSGGPTAQGTETYVMGVRDLERNMAVVERENSVITKEKGYKENYEGYDPNDPTTKMILASLQAANLDNSIAMALKVQKQFKDKVGRIDRGVKQAPLMVLHQSGMAGVLIELGFLTNADEEKFLKSDESQNYLASAIYRAFKEYKFELEGNTPGFSDEENGIGTKPTPVDTIKPAPKPEPKPEPKPAPLPEPKTEPKVEPKPEPKKDSTNTTTAIVWPGSKDTIASIKPAATPANEADVVFYRVQIATSATKLTLEAKVYKDFADTWEYEAGGLFKYTMGKTTNYTEAISLQRKAREGGYKDAFVVAFLNGKRVTCCPYKKE